MAPTDEELLRDYGRDRSAAAFAALVERHLNLVYSVARRQVRSDALAQEVAQAVFVDLAREATQLKAGTPLVAWLHLVARRTAIDVVRREARRRAREHEAAQLAEAMNPPESSWTDVEPLLDEAVESLPEPDRTAILLRFFENKSLREVGAALGTSDDAAQKRVSRALDALRGFLLRRGVTITAAGLVTDLSARTVEAAPAGLGAIISTAALGTGGATAAALATSRALAMTTLQKSAALLAFAAVGGFGLYQAALFGRQHEELDALRTRTARLTADLRALRARRDQTATQLKSVEGEIDTRLAAGRPAAPADPALEGQMRAWLARVEQVKRYFAQHPDRAIPELASLSAENWFSLGDGALDSEPEVRRAAARARGLAEDRYKANLSQALRAFAKAHDDALPATPAELAPYCDPPVERAILDRYELRATGKLADLPAADRSSVLTVKSPIDPEFDSIPQIGSTGYGTTSAWGLDVRDALRRFAQENPGQQPLTPAQLRPYLKWPLRDELIARVLAPAPSR